MNNKNIVKLLCPFLALLMLVGCVSSGGNTENTTYAEQTTLEEETAEETTTEETEEDPGEKIMNISAVSRTGAESTVYFRDWTFADSLCGFSAKGDSLKAAKTYAEYTQISGGALSSPADTIIPAESVKTFELRIKTSSAEKLTLAWQVSGDENISGNASISLKNDGKFHDYQINLSSVENYTGTVRYFELTLGDGQSMDIEYIRLSGIYLVPFPWIGGNLSADVKKLNQFKTAFYNQYHTTTVGFSALVQYLDETDADDKLALSGLRSVEYLVELAKAADMPVMIWLRADPWGDVNRGVAKKLYDDDKNLMWTEEITESPAYRYDMTGYYYYSLAEKDLDGNKTKYWQYTEDLLSQCAAEVAKAIEENPGVILGVTTTSEYKYNTEGNEFVLDYNPNTIAQFRDYCKEKYGTVEKLNSECETDFKTWELRSTDYDPVSVENQGGFDAPREKFKPDAFWKVWTQFRAQLISDSEQKLVDIIGQHIDAKYIYTHQIAQNNYTHASPITCGQANGANIGIDFFNSEATTKNFQTVTDMINGDVSKTWGIPEWLAMHKATEKETEKVLGRMAANGIKYICPFNWGSGDEYDFKDSGSEKAITGFVTEYDSKYNILTGKQVTATSGFVNGAALLDKKNDTVFNSASFKPGDWISFDLVDQTWVHTITLVPGQAGIGLPERVSVMYKEGDGWKEIGSCSLSGLSDHTPAVIVFDSVLTNGIKLVIDTPAKTENGEYILSLAEITAR